MFFVLVPKLELSSLYTSACRSLGACATRGGQALPDSQAKPDLVRPQGQLINRVKVPVGVSHNVVAESNCVIAKWGGEQLEAKG